MLWGSHQTIDLSTHAISTSPYGAWLWLLSLVACIISYYISCLCHSVWLRANWQFSSFVIVDMKRKVYIIYTVYDMRWWCANIIWVIFCPTLNHFVRTKRCPWGPICCVKYWVSNITRDSGIMDHTGISTLLTGDQRNTTKTNICSVFSRVWEES